MFSNANYFLNFQKLLGFAKGVKVDNETSQRQILEMYRKGGAYNGKDIPWDVRKVQPAVEQLEREGIFNGIVLDAGCGYGDNGIFLAQKGYRVVGFDFSPEAIVEAKRRAAEADVGHLTEWVVADALHVSKGPLCGRRFDVVLDSACMQCFDPKTQSIYLDNVHGLVKAGGCLVLLVVCNESQLRSWCRGVAWMAEHIRTLLTAQARWQILSSQETTFIENIPSVRITKGQRDFLTTTESPCLGVIAKPVAASSLWTSASAATLASVAVMALTFAALRAHR
jgi:SAM-dependent methyltransferase